jgi:hypothetical protein
MGISTKEYEELKASARFYLQHSDDHWGYDLIDRETGESCGSDAAEPEDKSLGRDLFWVVELANRLGAEIARLREENARLQINSVGSP